MAPPRESFMSQIKVAIVPVTPFQQNCSILICQATKKARGGRSRRRRAADPPRHRADRRAASRRSCSPTATPTTPAAPRNCATFSARPSRGRRSATNSCSTVSRPLRALFGFACRNVTPDRWLDEGDTSPSARRRFDVRHCPGHTPGSVVFVNRADAVLSGRRRAVPEFDRPRRPAGRRLRHAHALDRQTSC